MQLAFAGTVIGGFPIKQTWENLLKRRMTMAVTTIWSSIEIRDWLTWFARNLYKAPMFFLKATIVK